MQRSSETIGAIAAALAKAQAQLVNPEKSLVGTLGLIRLADRSGRFVMHHFRAASILCAKP
ncbi:MAG: hypothetical protein WBO12_22810 [Xanthobacteraceae bacterium]|jgi:hypothetical protein